VGWLACTTQLVICRDGWDGRLMLQPLRGLGGQDLVAQPARRVFQISSLGQLWAQSAETWG
jgi:hypothetical protein